MKALEEKIRKEGQILPGNILKVGSFLNQQIDVDFLMAMGEEVARAFAGQKITKVLTVEASGIAFAVAIAAHLHVPAVFAKKSKSANVSGELYSTVVHSYTHGNDNTVTVPKAYLSSEDVVLLADDFMANGAAAEGLIRLVEQAGAALAGIAIEIEKGFQGGGDALRRRGIRVESLAVVDSMENGAIEFRTV